ncbi:MAG: hypothetical protein V3T05_12220, partial [Myxococcota bacterium]
MLRSIFLAAGLIFPVFAAAQGEDEADSGPATGMTEAPTMDAGLEASGLPILPPDHDAHGGDKDPMKVDANAGQRPPGGDDAMVGGHRDSVIQGGGAILPQGTNDAVPIGGGTSVADIAGFEVGFSGFLQVEGALSIFDNKHYEVTFLPREIELDLSAKHDAGATLRLDFNLISRPGAQSSSSGLEREVDLIDKLVEQAYVEWSSRGFTLRGGKMNAPFGGEPLDAHER